MRLPNSGLLVQFTMMYGLNPDVSGSEEAGTTPDVPSPAGEPALVTALRAITAGGRPNGPKAGNGVQGRAFPPACEA